MVRGARARLFGDTYRYPFTIYSWNEEEGHLVRSGGMGVVFSAIRRIFVSYM